MEKSNYCIGIDLGTTYSCVGIWRNNRIEIIQNEMGERTISSVVSFNNDKILIGDLAKRQIIKNYKNTIYDVKRLIGRNYSDPIVQEDMKLWPFKLEKDNKDKPLICVEYNKQEKKFYPEQISAMILERLKEYAEDYLNTKIKDAVITVPAYFNNIQRQATIDAGRIAGLNVIKIINEPTAAAIAYGLNEKIQGKRNICIFDLGGGTFDVTILEINNNKFTDKATGGDTHLGGEDLDNLLVEFCIQKFKEETNIDISNNQKAKRRLKIECTKLKIELSFMHDGNLEIDSIAEGEDLNFEITRNDFNNICDAIFNKCIKVLKDTIKDSGLSKNEIDKVILIGGSSRIPKIEEMIIEYFNRNIILKTINVDEAVACGASIISALQMKIEDETINNINFIDVCPFSLGIACKGGLMSVIIKRNSSIPISIKKKFKTVEDFQNNFVISVYEGEKKFVKDNLKISYFKFEKIRIAPKGEVQIEITFELNSNGILKVTGKEIGNDNEKVYEIIMEKRKKEEILIDGINKMNGIDLENINVILKQKLNDIKREENFYNKYKNTIEEKYNKIHLWIKQNDDKRKKKKKKKIKEFDEFISKLKKE